MVGVSETWFTGHNPYLSSTWTNQASFVVPATREHSTGRASGGIMLLCKRDTCNATLIDSCNMWILSLCKVANSSFILGVVYIKPSLDMKTALGLLQEVIQLARDLHPQAPLLLLGDFNARIGTLSGEVADILEGTALYPTRQSRDQTVNQRGQLLMDFMIENGLIVLNGRTTSDYPGHLTFVNLAGGSTIDLMMISAGHVDLVNDLTVAEGPLSSDHFPILSRLNMHREPDRPPPADDTSMATQTRLKWLSSKSTEYGELLSRELTLSRLDEATDVNSLLSHLISSISSAASTLGMTSTKRTTGRRLGAPKHPWFDSNCRAARTGLRKALRKTWANHFSKSARLAYLSRKENIQNTVDTEKKQLRAGVEGQICVCEMLQGLLAGVQQHKAKKEHGSMH